MKIEERSALSQEKFADSLMSLANNLIVSLWSGLLISPIAGLVIAILSDGEATTKILCSVYAFVCLFGIGVAYMQVKLKGRAMDVYDRLGKTKNFHDE
jgi:hypothetical protein